MYVYMYVCMSACMYVCVCIYVCMYNVCVYVCVCVCLITFKVFVNITEHFRFESNKTVQFGILVSISSDLCKAHYYLVYFQLILVFLLIWIALLVRGTRSSAHPIGWPLR